MTNTTETNYAHVGNDFTVTTPHWWEFCGALADIAKNHRPVRIAWDNGTHTTYSGVEFGSDAETGDEYMWVGFVTNHPDVYIEIDDGTYGTMNGFRVFTGRQA